MDYINASLPRAIQSNDRVRAAHEDKRDFVADETKIPKRIFANNIFRNKLRYMQDLKNYEFERDRLKGYVNSKGPSFRDDIITHRIEKLNKKLEKGSATVADLDK
jgi:hypothetical protein